MRPLSKLPYREEKVLGVHAEALIDRHPKKKSLTLCASRVFQLLSRLSTVSLSSGCMIKHRAAIMHWVHVREFGLAISNIHALQSKLKTTIWQDSAGALYHVHTRNCLQPQGVSIKKLKSVFGAQPQSVVLLRSQCGVYAGNTEELRGTSSATWLFSGFLRLLVQSMPGIASC